MENLIMGANPYQVIGIIGFVAYMASFAMLQARLIDGNGPAYCLLNILAASLVLVSLLDAFNLASLLIQVSWIIIGIFGLCFQFWRRTQR